MVLKDKLTPVQRVLDELIRNDDIIGCETGIRTRDYPQVARDISKALTANTEAEDECTGCGKPFQHYAHKLCPACWGKAHTEPEGKCEVCALMPEDERLCNTEPEDEAFEKEFQDWERVKKHIALRKIDEFTEATRERYEQVDEIPLLDEFGDWLQHEDK